MSNPNGAFLGKHHTPETRAKLSASHKGVKYAPGRKGAWAGKKQPVELIEKRAAKMRGRKRPPFSAEWLARMSVAKRGKKYAPGRRSAMLGKKQSPATRAKISASGLGNTYSKNAPSKGACVYCLGIATSYDHVIPRGRPGWDAPDNLVPACRSCNSSKRDRTPGEWFYEEHPCWFCLAGALEMSVPQVLAA